MLGPTSKTSHKSGENPNISLQISPNILNTVCGGQIEVFCCRSSSVTQIIKWGDFEVGTVSKGSEVVTNGVT